MIIHTLIKLLLITLELLITFLRNGVCTLIKGKIYTRTLIAFSLTV